MLSFQKDEQTIPAVEQTGQALEAQPQSAQSHNEDYLTVAGHKQKLKQSTIILTAVFVVGGLSLWMMIRKAVPASAAAASKVSEVSEIESAIAQINGMQSEVNTQMKSVTSRLNHLSEVGQISVDDLRKNPFSRDADSGGDLSSEDASQREFLLEQTRRTASALQLWTITASPQGLSCMINEKLLRVGDVIEGFTIKEIRTASVILEQQGIVVELRME